MICETKNLTAETPRHIWRLLEYPKIVPDALLEDRVGTWVEDRGDVGFRMGMSAHEGVIARRLFPVQMIICALPAYLPRHGMERPTGWLHCSYIDAV